MKIPKSKIFTEFFESNNKSENHVIKIAKDIIIKELLEWNILPNKAIIRMIMIKW